MKIYFTAVLDDESIPDTEGLPDAVLRVCVQSALKYGWKDQEFDLDLLEITATGNSDREDECHD